MCWWRREVGSAPWPCATRCKEPNKRPAASGQLTSTHPGSEEVSKIATTQLASDPLNSNEDAPLISNRCIYPNCAECGVTAPIPTPERQSTPAPCASPQLAGLKGCARRRHRRSSDDPAFSLPRGRSHTAQLGRKRCSSAGTKTMWQASRRSCVSLSCTAQPLTLVGTRGYPPGEVISLVPGAIEAGLRLCMRNVAGWIDWLAESRGDTVFVYIGAGVAMDGDL